MGTLQSGVELYDGFTAPLNNIINALNLTVSAFETMQQVSGNEIDTASLQGAREAANQATIALQAMEDQLSHLGDIPEIPTPEAPDPVEVPVVWQSDNVPVFTNTGIERFQQEIENTNSMMNRLNQTQQRITAQAGSTNIFPPNAVSDMNAMQGRIQTIQNRINQISSNPINMGSDVANAELEQLRAQLDQAIAAQDALNSAVDEMDVERANDAYTRLSQIVAGTERYIRDNVDEQGTFNDAINEGAAAATNLESIIKGAVGAFAGVAAIRKAYGFIQESTELFNTQLNSEIQLSTVLGNMLEDNVGGAFDAITAKASEIQSKGIYGDEAMIAGAAELATYFSDADALLSMMDTLYNYAMGMSGGGALDSKAMTDYATGIGKIMTGSYDAMTKKGFEFTDAQKAIIEGTATQAQIVEALGEEYLDVSEEMQAAAAINSVIAESWDGLYESMSNTPEGKILQLQNAFGDLKEEVGMGVYPYIIAIVDTINANSGTIESVISGITGALEFMLGVLGWIIEAAANTYTVISENWSWIGPIVYGVIAALAAYAAYLGILKAIEIASAAGKIILAVASYAHAAATGTEASATAAATAAQYGLNTAMLASPVTWIVIAVIALVAALVAVANQIAKTTGIAKTGFGVITGGVNVAIQAVKNAGLTIANVGIGIWEALGAVCSNIGTAFHNVIANVQGWFFNLLSTALTVVAGICEALNKLPFVEFDYSGIVNKADEYAAKSAEAYGSVEDYTSIADAFDAGFHTFDTFTDGWASDAFAAGAAWGDGIAETVSDFSLTDLFNVDALDMSDYISAYEATGNGGTSLANDVADIAGNTGSIADSLSVTDEELKYLRDIAEMEVVNRFTTAEITIEQTNNNNVSSGADLDGITEGLIDGLNEAIEVVTEGDHS